MPAVHLACRKAQPNPALYFPAGNSHMRLYPSRLHRLGDIFSLAAVKAANYGFPLTELFQNGREMPLQPVMFACR